MKLIKKYIGKFQFYYAQLSSGLYGNCVKLAIFPLVSKINEFTYNVFPFGRLGNLTQATCEFDFSVEDLRIVFHTLSQSSIPRCQWQGYTDTTDSGNNTLVQRNP